MDQTHHDLMDGVDRRLDPLVSNAPLPADLLRRGQRRRRRRTTSRVVATAAAVAVVASAGVALGERATPTGPAADSPSTGPASAPVPPSEQATTAVPQGMHLVGYDRLAVAIPDTWQVDANGCNRVEPTTSPLYFADGGDTAPCGQRPSVSVERLGRGNSGAMGAGSRELTLNGLDVVYRDQCGSAALCVYPHFVRVVVPSLALAVFVGGVDGDRELVHQIADSIRPLPDHVVAVPPIFCCADDRVAVRILENVGLVADVPDVDYPHYVIGVKPGPGTLVVPGSTVEIRVGDG